MERINTYHGKPTSLNVIKISICLVPSMNFPQSSVYLHGVKVTILMTHKSKKKVTDYSARAATADYHTCKELLHENILDGQEQKNTINCSALKS